RSRRHLMQARSFSGSLAVLLLLAGGAVLAGAGQPAKHDSPPLPREIVAAWQKAGIAPPYPVWMGLNAHGRLGRQENATGLTGAVPAFAFRRGGWKDGVVANLAVPAAPFGLD